MKKIALFVEGEGEADAVPWLIKQILTEQSAWDSVILDKNAFRVGNISKLIKHNYRDWKRLLSAKLKSPNLGGVLLILDGDIRTVDKLFAIEECDHFNA